MKNLIYYLLVFTFSNSYCQSNYEKYEGNYKNSLKNFQNHHDIRGSRTSTNLKLNNNGTYVMSLVVYYKKKGKLFILNKKNTKGNWEKKKNILFLRRGERENVYLIKGKKLYLTDKGNIILKSMRLKKVKKFSCSFDNSTG